GLGLDLAEDGVGLPAGGVELRGEPAGQVAPADLDLLEGQNAQAHGGVARILHGPRHHRSVLPGSGSCCRSRPKRITEVSRTAVGAGGTLRANGRIPSVSDGNPSPGGAGGDRGGGDRRPAPGAPPSGAAHPGRLPRPGPARPPRFPPARRPLAARAVLLPDVRLLPPDGRTGGG